MGGETADNIELIAMALGLSPRGRGNRRQRHQDGDHERSIPAWAGKPYVESTSSRTHRVYPRVGGETIPLPKPISSARGLSPRGRGNLVELGLCLIGLRSIPAWAGKPKRLFVPPDSRRVYPRVGGETAAQGDMRDYLTGLSPRGRGNLTHLTLWIDNGGSIPAWAGKPRSTMRTSRSHRVYPRVGGETRISTDTRRLLGGLSPRGRGNPGRAGDRAEPHRSIPAWAGKPYVVDATEVMYKVYPRVGGETNSATLTAINKAGLSPRGRGNPLLV